MTAKNDIFVLKTSSSTDSDGNIFERPALNLKDYKLDLLDHPKSGNQGYSSMSKLSLNKINGGARHASPHVSPHTSSSMLHASGRNLFQADVQHSSSRRQSGLLSPASSKGALGSTASIKKLDRSIKGSSHYLSIPVDVTHQKAIQEVISKDGSFSVASFIMIKNSVSQDIAVLKKHETGDMDGTLKFQLLSVKNAKAKLQATILSELVNEAQAIKYIFISSLLCILPAADSLVFVLDFHSSNLQQILNQNHRRMHENGAKFYMAEILMGLDYLHERNICYRDLNPENILITEAGHVKLVNPIMWSGINKTMGTPGCNIRHLNIDMSPESIHQNVVSKASDIWSYACILFELLTGGEYHKLIKRHTIPP